MAEELLGQEEMERILEVINQRMPNPKCPMCQGTKFTISRGYISNVLQNELGEQKLAGYTIPSIPVICINCGFISQHALGALGLMQKKESDQHTENSK